MNNDTLIFLFDTFAIILLIGMALMLMAATRFKGVGSYATLIIFTTTLPHYIYIACGYFHFDGLALLIAPIAYSVNLTIMPFMLFLAHRAFNPNYRFRYSVLIHFLPAVAFAVLVSLYLHEMSINEVANFSVEHAASFRYLLTSVNFLVVTVQLATYFYMIFRYLRKAKQYVFSNYSQAELSGKVWVPRFITVLGVLMLAAMVSSHFHPFGGFRMFYFINVVAMGYLLYQELEHAHAFRRHHSMVIAMPEEEINNFDATLPQSETGTEEESTQLKQYALQVEAYLKQSEAYVNPSLSLAEVAKATGISARNISRSINGELNKTFFDLVNGMRIEKSKYLLQNKKQFGLTLETIAEQCGFNSQFTFCRAFKKCMGVSTSEWLRKVK